MGMKPMRTATRIPDFFLRISFQANPFPAALGLAFSIGNIMSWCDAELMHDSIANDRTELVSGQSPPAMLIAKLDVSGITIRHR